MHRFRWNYSNIALNTSEEHVCYNLCEYLGYLYKNKTTYKVYNLTTFIYIYKLNPEVHTYIHKQLL